MRASSVYSLILEAAAPVSERVCAGGTEWQSCPGFPADARVFLKSVHAWPRPAPGWKHHGMSTAPNPEHSAATSPVAGSVVPQATTMPRATPQRTADARRAAQTLTMDPVIVCVVGGAAVEQPNGSDGLHGPGCIGQARRPVVMPGRSRSIVRLHRQGASLPLLGRLRHACAFDPTCSALPSRPSRARLGVDD